MADNFPGNVTGVGFHRETALAAIIADSQVEPGEWGGGSGLCGTCRGTGRTFVYDGHERPANRDEAFVIVRPGPTIACTFSDDAVIPRSDVKLFDVEAKCSTQWCSQCHGMAWQDYGDADYDELHARALLTALGYGVEYSYGGYDKERRPIVLWYQGDEDVGWQVDGDPWDEACEDEYGLTGFMPTIPEDLWGEALEQVAERERARRAR